MDKDSVQLYRDLGGQLALKQRKRLWILTIIHIVPRKADFWDVQEQREGPY